MLKILILTAAVLLSENSHACTCGPETLEEAFAKYHSVFRGTVAKIIKGDGVNSIHLNVETVWKGKPGKKIVVTTASGSAACGFPFLAKKEYILFAWQEKKGAPLSINSCSKTASADSALETLAWLDQHHSTDDGEL